MSLCEAPFSVDPPRMQVSSEGAFAYYKHRLVHQEKEADEWRPPACNLCFRPSETKTKPSCFLFSYHIAVVKVLRRRGLISAGTPLAGVSAGSLVAALVKCDVPTEDIQAMFFECVDDLRQQGTAGRIRGVLQAAMERHLPDNAHQLCSGGLFVGISELLPYPRHVQVSQFPSRAALIDALLTSCHLPRYSSPAWTLTYNGRPTVDGGFTAIVPSLPPSTGCHTVKVCCLPASRVDKLPFLNKREAMAGVAILPDWRQRADWAAAGQQTAGASPLLPNHPPAWAQLGTRRGHKADGGFDNSARPSSDECSDSSSDCRPARQPWLAGSRCSPSPSPRAPAANPGPWPQSRSSSPSAGSRVAQQLPGQLVSWFNQGVLRLGLWAQPQGSTHAIMPPCLRLSTHAHQHQQLAGSGEQGEQGEQDKGLWQGDEEAGSVDGGEASSLPLTCPHSLTSEADLDSDDEVRGAGWRSPTASLTPSCSPPLASPQLLTRTFQTLLPSPPPPLPSQQQLDLAAGAAGFQEGSQVAGGQWAKEQLMARWVAADELAAAGADFADTGPTADAATPLPLTPLRGGEPLGYRGGAAVGSSPGASQGDSSVVWALGAESEALGAAGGGEDAVLRDMVLWINSPAPSNTDYCRVMAKAERDTEAWLAVSGLAAAAAAAALDKEWQGGCGA
ncbi:hypothetical protein QJQ45_028417 [Haematococcus lacustris]|nr:hypothetical protein QJQ45_028417 [Haematococcus lacustris]